MPPLDAVVHLPAGAYVLGEPGEERTVTLARVSIGRYPVVNAYVPGPKQALADHPATDVTRADAEAFCARVSHLLGRRVRLPTGDEWEALARGGEGRTFPWGDVFEPDRCNSAESGWGWTVPVTVHPAGASPFGAEQLAGNVWEWVADRASDGWGVVRGGSYLDTAWGLRASRVLAADPERATSTTGFRIAIEEDE